MVVLGGVGEVPVLGGRVVGPQVVVDGGDVDPRGVEGPGGGRKRVVVRRRRWGREVVLGPDGHVHPAARLVTP